MNHLAEVTKDLPFMQSWTSPLCNRMVPMPVIVRTSQVNHWGERVPPARRPRKEAE